MAPGHYAPGEFRGGRDGACVLPIDLEASGRQAPRVDGPIFAASILRTSAILLRGTHLDGQRFHAERLEATRAIDGHLHRYAAHRDIVLQERGQARTPTETGFSH